MAGADSQVLGRMYAAWSAGDRDGALEWFADDAEFRTSGAFPGLRPVYHGRAGVGAFWDAFREMWDSIQIDTEHLIDADGRAIGLWRFRALGRDGLRVGRDGGHVARLRDGLIVDLQACGDWGEPFELVPPARPADLVRRGYDALNAGDLAAMRELVDPDCRTVPLLDRLEGTAYRGPEGMLEYRRDMLATWEEVHWRPERMDVWDDGRVLCEPLMRARGRDGIRIDQRVAVVVSFREQLISDVRGYASEAEAVRAMAGRYRPTG